MGGHIPDEIIERVRESHNIVDLISGFLSLKKTGQNYSGLCPFHSEKTPSFVVSPAKQIFHCFGCGAGGDVFRFLMQHDRMTFPEAVRTLAERAGIAIPLSRGERMGNPDGNSVFFRIHQEAAEFYHRLLKSEEGRRAVGYLEKRGISSATISDFQIGYAPDRWETLVRHLLSKGFQPAELEKTGLILAKEKGRGHYDRFRGRIIFPILDLQKRVVGFGGRIFEESSSGTGGSGPKYLNSSESPVFQKGRCLYGLDKAREGIREFGSVMVVEGYMDLITAHQAGIRHVVATMGTALTPDHLTLLKRFTKEVILTFDADAAGFKAVLRTWELVNTGNLQIRVLLLPEGEDPDSYIRREGKEAFLDRMRKAPDLVDYLLDQKVGKGAPASIHQRAEIAEECLSILEHVPNRIRQDLYVRKMANRLGIAESLLISQLLKRQHAQVKRNGGDGSYEKRADQGQLRHPGQRTEETLIAILLQKKEYRGRTRNLIGPDAFTDDWLSEMARVILDPVSEDVEPSRLIEKYRDAAWVSRLSELSLLELGYDDVEKAWKDTLTSMKRHGLERQMAQVRQELASPAAVSEERLLHLLQMQNRLTQQKTRLNEKFQH